MTSGRFSLRSTTLQRRAEHHISLALSFVARSHRRLNTALTRCPTGFWSIFFLGVVPNAAFDVAGVLCGQLGIDLKTFFGAIALAKVIRTPMQAAFTILICSERSTSSFITFFDGAKLVTSTSNSTVDSPTTPSPS